MDDGDFDDWEMDEWEEAFDEDVDDLSELEMATGAGSASFGDDGRENPLCQDPSQ